MIPKKSTLPLFPGNRGFFPSGPSAPARRSISLSGIPTIPYLDRDEYPFASTQEGHGHGKVGRLAV